MAVNGIFTSDSSWVGDRQNDFASAILRTVATGDTPLYALSAGTRDVRARDTIVRWREQGELTGRVKITVPPIAASANSFQLEDVSMIARSSILIVEATGEQLFVVGVSGYVVTVIRGWAGTTIYPITSTAGTPGYVKLLTRAFEEGSDPPPGYVTQPTQRYNLTQIFRSTAEVTGTADAVYYSHGPAMERTRGEAMNDHAIQIENAMLLGRRSENAQNGKPLRTMNGLIEHILSNRFVIPATGLSYDMLNSLIQAAFSRKVKGYPQERIWFCGNQALAVINTIAKAHSIHVVSSDQKKFGLSINTWRTTFGEIKFVTHPKFNSDPTLMHCLIAYHPGMIRRRTLRPTARWVSDYNAGRDVRATYYITEMSMEYWCEDTGILVSGLYNADPN